MFSFDDISGINYIRLNSNPIQAPSHEIDEIEIKIPPVNVIDRRQCLASSMTSRFHLLFYYTL
jgi:hypothetical protein